MRAREKKTMVKELCPDCDGTGERRFVSDYKMGLDDRWTYKTVRCERCWGSGRIVTTTIVQETPYYRP